MSFPVAITFHPDGTATTLHTDLIPLQELGHCKITRASWIDFNEHTQQWEVRFGPHDDYPAFAHPERSECLRWEHNYFLNQFLA